MLQSVQKLADVRALPVEWIAGSAALWAVFGATFNVITLTYAALSQHFGPAFAGRANTGMNLLSGTGAFLLQYAIGAVIGLWPQTAAGGYDPAGYRFAFAALLALQAVAFVWFLNYRAKSITAPPAITVTLKKQPLIKFTMRL